MNSITIGMDLGDKNNVICVIDNEGAVIKSSTVENTTKAIRKYFKPFKGALVALEAGTHSPWISRLLDTLGCKVLVGNPRKLRVIWKSDQKCDERDAEMLARIARFEPDLLYPITHKGRQAQVDMEMLQAREILVKNRTSLINHVRGSVKALGERIPSCSAHSFYRHAPRYVPSALRESLKPILDIIEQLTLQIKSFDKQIEQISKERYPETELLRAIKGVGALTALAYTLTIEDPERFSKSRKVGCFVGLTPRRDQSGETDKQLRITKAGNSYLRKLLVGSAQYILGAFGEDCNLRRFGFKLAKRGGKNAKKRAVVAVARKLAVLMHRLWKRGEIYEPLYSIKAKGLQEAV
jgi:transposase